MPSVLENRASATLWNRGPKTGTLSLNASTRARPASVFLYRLNPKTAPIATPRMTMHQYVRSVLETAEEHPGRERQRAAEVA